MKFRIIYLLIIVLLSSCGNLFETYDDKEGYRDDLGSGALINDGSLIGQWEQTAIWYYGGGEAPSSWSPVNMNSNETYVFLEDGTFTSTNKISDCTGSNGIYIIEGTQITLTYICETQPTTTKEILIDEFFFTENYIVLIKGDGFNSVSKFEFVN